MLLETDKVYAPAESPSPMFSTAEPSETVTLIPHSNLLLALVRWPLEFSSRSQPDQLVGRDESLASMLTRG